MQVFFEKDNKSNYFLGLDYTVKFNTRKMKKFFLLILCCITLSSAYSQKKRVLNNPNYDRKWIHFGFTLGLNTMDFTIDNSEALLASDNNGRYELDKVYGVENQYGPGFHIGPIVNLRLGKYFDARALFGTLSFGQRTLLYRMRESGTNGDPEYTTLKMPIESVFVEFPLQIKYKSQRLNNYRPYLIGGINPKIDLAARKKIKEDEIKIRLNRFDAYYEVGFGVDYYLPYFKFSTELKLSVGLTDVTVHDDTQYTHAIERMNSKMIMLSFHFE